MQKIRLKRKQREWLNGYLFIGLWLIGLLVFTIFPLMQAIFYSFNHATFKPGTLSLSGFGLTISAMRFSKIQFSRSF